MDILNLNDENLNILPTALTVISASLVLYITLFITERFKNKVSKKRREMYIKFLRRYNKIIDKYISDFEKTKLSEGKPLQKDAWQLIYMLMGLFLGFFLTLILFIIINNILKIDIWRSMAYAGFINFLPYILVIDLTRYVRRKENELLDKSDRIEYWFKGIKSFILCSSILTHIPYP